MKPDIQTENTYSNKENCKYEAKIGEKLNKYLPDLFPKHYGCYTYETQDHAPFVVSISDFVEGKHIDTWLSDNPSPKETRAVFRSCVEAGQELAKHGLVFTNVKSQNAHITNGEKFVITDFGGIDSIDQKRTGGDFNSMHMPPENVPPINSVEERHGVLTEKGGVHQIGSLIAGIAPNGGDLPASFYRLLNEMLQEEPEQRPTFAQALADDFFQTPLQEKETYTRATGQSDAICIQAAKNAYFQNIAQNAKNPQGYFRRYREGRQFITQAVQEIPFPATTTAGQAGRKLADLQIGSHLSHSHQSDFHALIADCLENPDRPLEQVKEEHAFFIKPVQDIEGVLPDQPFQDELSFEGGLISTV